uniref:GIN domain-containing protein n=1 Tax=Pedobacter schmidteae TaxID=2201271 RepID=UPI000EB18116|nr:DUF2807 domain-containing protein [Pedobacter schmidteae]
MKTLTKTLFATVAAAILLTSSSMTTLAANRIENVKPTAGFNKIWVSGNVKLVLTQSAHEGIFVDENFNKEKTSILGKGQTLYINSMESSQVVIKISMKDLQRIEAAGSSTVVTSDKFDVKCLQVILSQSATAKIKAIAGSLYTNVSDEARLKMTGVTDQHTSIASNVNNVKLDNLLSLSTRKPSSDVILAAEQLTVNKLK